jgi:hypothetical protein
VGHGDKTGEHLEMVAARASNDTAVEDEVDLWAA